MYDKDRVENQDLSSFKNLFLKTAHEYLENLKTGFAALSSDPSNKEIIGEVYISAHSLKSQSWAMGYTQTAALCSIIEMTLREIKEGKKIISKDLLTSLLTALEPLERSIDNIEHENTEIDLESHINRLELAMRVKVNLQQ